MAILALKGGFASAPTPEFASPFPSVPRMTDSQHRAMALLTERATALSTAATPALLARLDSEPMRRHLATCCQKAGVARWTARALLDELRLRMSEAELVHNFDTQNFETDMTIEILLHNATSYFPTLWPLRFLGYYGLPLKPEWGHPFSPEKCKHARPVSY